MAVTNQELFNIFLANPNMSDAQIVSLMETQGISPEQVSSTFGIPVGEVVSRAAAVVPPGQTVTLGDTIVQPQYQITGSGENQQIGGIENVLAYKVSDNQVGGGYTQYTPTGEVERTGTQQKVQNLAGEALLGSAVLFGGLGGGFDSLFGGGGAGTVGATGLTEAQLAQLDLALGGAGGSTGAAQLASALTTGAAIPTITSLTGGSGLLTGAAGGITAESVAQKLAADAVANTTTGGLLTNTAANTALTNTAANTALTNTAANTALTNTAGNVANTALTATQVADLAKTGLTAAQIAQLLSTGTQTAAGLLQQQTSKDAAQKAQAMIDAETAAAKQAAQFRPVGMTTRFGTSQFTVDPRTGQLTSAGYTLSPEAKAAQDQFVKLAEAGIVQAKEAQQQFAPLQTGAQNLFNLGNQYIAQSPQEVAQNYLNQQMALLQPGRELELANLQNKLQQQGRGGLAVSQGGTYGATTPELQALYNARAMQEAQLAANAQQFGQQNVQFGAGLLGTGAQTMGNYYAGQQAAYAPYTTALGQVQALETAAQQPLMLGASLGQQSSTAGARAGALGLEGANISQRLATGAAATNNPYASLLSGAASNPAFNQIIGGLFSSVPAMTAMSTPATSFGSGGYYGNQDLGLFL